MSDGSQMVGWVEERNPTLSLVNLTVHWAVVDAERLPEG